MGGRLKGNEIFYKNKAAALTLLFSKKKFKQYVNDVNPQYKIWKSGDYPLLLWFHINSKIGFLNKVTACYRVLDNSASHFKDGHKRVLFNYSNFKIANYFAKSYLDLTEYNRFLNYRLFNLGLSVIKHKSPFIKEVLKMISKITNKHNLINNF